MTKKNTKILRSLLLSSIFSLAGIIGFAQTVLIDPSAEGGFELGPTFADNGWTVVNTATTNGSQWFTTAASLTNGAYSFSPTGSRAAYVSSDLGVTWSYQTPSTASSASHFYRDVTFPAGETAINLSFRFNASGESTWDDIHVYLCPTTLTPVSNQPSSASTNPTWTGTGSPIFINRYNLLAAGTGSIVNVNIPPSIVGNCSSDATWRIVFTWKNDGSGGTNPPAAIDDISLISANPTSLITSSGGLFTIDNTLPTGGTNFNNFTDAINALNIGGACGFVSPLIFDVTAGQTFAELPPVITASGSLGAEITFQKNGVGANPVIISTGTTSTADGSLVVSGGDYFTFDGIDINNSASSTMEYGYLLRAFSATNGAQYNVIKNASISLNRNNTTSTSSAILITASTTGGGFTPTAATGSNSYNQLTNITINDAFNGIYLNGNSTYPDSNNSVNATTGNRNTITNIGPLTSTFAAARGIYALNQNSIIISKSDVTNVAGNQSATYGIHIAGARGNSQVTENKIYNVSVFGSTTTTSSAYGLSAAQATSGTHNILIANNMISNVYTSFTGTATATRRAFGLFVGVASASASQVYDVFHNSVSIGNGLTPTYSNSCFEIQNISAVYNVQNNIFANFTNAQTGVARHSVWVSTTTNIGATGSISNRNDLFVANDLGVTGFTGKAGTTDFATLNNWTAGITGAPGTDLNSANINPMFVNNNTDLHLNLGTAATQIESGGSLLSVTVDIDGDVRPGPIGSINGGATAPDMGADEFDGFPAAPPSITFNAISPSTTQCVATARLISVDVVNASGTLSSVVVNYSYNGIAQTPINMTNTVGSTWEATIPAATPGNANVTWSIVATNSIPLAFTYNGTAYRDEPLTGYTAVATTSQAVICPSEPTDLSAQFNLGTLASYLAPPAVSNPTTDEDLGNVTITQGATTIINNTTTGGDLNGSIGTATGTAGSYSNFTDFGPYTLTPGETYNFSLTSITQGSNYGNRMAIWIDYNRNGVFTDAGEQAYVATTSVTGPHTETGTFTVPATANPGITRMRVLVNEGTISSPTQSVSWGEYEEYAINLNPTITTVTWSDGVSTVGTTNPLTVNPTSTTTYTATITASGCTLAPSPSVLVTVTPVNAVLTGVDASCYGLTDGTFTLGTVTCGTAPFDYSVNAGAFGPIPTNLAPGTYSVVIRDAGLFLSSPITITVGEPAAVPTPVSGTNAVVCQNETSAQISASYTGTSTLSIPLTLPTVESNSSPGTVIGTGILSALPAGAVVTSVTLNVNDITPQGNSWQSDVRLGLTGAITNAAAAGSGAASNNSNFNYTSTLPIGSVNVAGGSVDVLYWDNYNDVTATEDALFNAPTATITITYTVSGGTGLSWWDAPSAGNNLGTGSPFETVGTSVLTTTATPGTYTFYAQGQNGTCFSATRLPVTVLVNALPTVGAGADATICPGQSFTLSGTGASTYTWDNTVINATPFTPSTSATYTVIGTDLNGCTNTDAVDVSLFTPPTVLAGSDFSICNGEIALLLGSGALNYSWDNGVTNGVAFTPASTLTYVVTGTDINGCTDTDDIQVTVNPLPVVNAGIDQEICAGSSVTVAGSGALTYTWDNGVTDAMAFVPGSPATYTVTGTDINGCINTDDVFVTVNALPSVNAGADFAICQNGQATLSATGASTYSWNNGITNNVSFAVLATSTYTVTGTDVNGCINTDDVTITANALPNVNAGNNIEQCGDQNVTLNASGAVAYSWNNGVTDGVAFNSPFGTTAYIVTGVDATGCSNTDIVLVTINTIPVATATAVDALTITATPANASYQWIDCATNNPILGATNPTFTATVNGSYAVIVTGVGGCSDTSACVIVDEVGLTSLTDEMSMNVYPNPTNGKLNISLSSVESANIQVFDAQGKLIVTIKDALNESIIDLSNVEPGVYMIHMNSGNSTAVHRVIKN